MKISEVAARNLAEAKKFKSYLRVMPRVVILYAADSAITAAMQPARSNYTEGHSARAGDLMPHSSSNAAWNWRIGFGGAEANPLNAKDSSPVGWAFEERSSNTYGTFSSIAEVIRERREIDINKKLYNKLLAKTNLKTAIPKISLYNNIDRLDNGSSYASNANLRNVVKKLPTYAASGAQLSYAVLREYMRGSDGAPDTEALLTSLQGKQGGNFVNWR